MTRAGATLDDVPARIPWRALRAFADCVMSDERSMTFRARYPKYGGWTHVEAMLADIFDMVVEGNRTTAALSGKKPRKAKPYPRPWENDRLTRKLGRDPVTKEEFEKFWGGGADGGQWTLGGERVDRDHPQS